MIRSGKQYTVPDWGVELQPEFVAFLEAHEPALKRLFRRLNVRVCSISGQFVSRAAWINYLDRKDYYTSPLYKALS